MQSFGATEIETDTVNLEVGSHFYLTVPASGQGFAASDA